jgi:twinkle protein
LFYPKPGKPTPPAPQWKKTLGKIAFRPAEVSLWAGINGHGKSMFLSQIVLDLINQKQKVLIISLEMTPAAQMQRMCRQAIADDKPSVDQIRKFHYSTDGKLWMYDQHGQIEWQKVIAICRYAQEKLGINHFVVDSMMKCVKGEDDYNGQKAFINDLCGFAMARSVHVHLVHHVRKGETSKELIPGKFDIKGSVGIADQVDNIFIVWRNKNAEAEIAKGERGKYDGDYTAVLKCEKARHGNWEGSLGFFFDPVTMQYLEEAGGIPARYSF